MSKEDETKKPKYKIMQIIIPCIKSNAYLVVLQSI